ncbi:MAG: DUF1549 and DUF1553 domain-containing protein, partial [Planctomycetes bacterium]|nr:DUF1549 and DUF1553 domain-containing protein [Planctomycetota bacterium]
FPGRCPGLSYLTPLGSKPRSSKGFDPQMIIAILFAALTLGAPPPTATPGANHWAYQLPKKAAVPGKGNPIDAFLDVERTKQKLTLNPETDKSALLRRIYLDLIGIPPTHDELHAFLKDTQPDAYEKVVDRLLASQMFGERWGRKWMDVWRYSDPFGLGEEYRYSQRHIWRWRDWIIDSLNKDKGYDRMIVEMLAADEVAPADPDTLRATGYLARNWYKFNRNVWIQDTVEYTAAGFLGVTMRCARCHDHKFDPISQQDYYRFRAFFEPHEVRIDQVPGQKDTNKDGLARAFDAKADAPTYLFQRGDERSPDKSKPLSPGVPNVLGSDPSVVAVKFSPGDFASGLANAAGIARGTANAELTTAQAETKRAADAVAAAKDRVQKVVAGIKSKDVELVPILSDTFGTKNDDLWKVVSGQWTWENGKLVCKTPSAFATVSAKKTHPMSLIGRIRYKTTGGKIGSVGFSYNVVGGNSQAVYINAGNGSAVRAFHRVNGSDTYPTEGVVPCPIKFNDEVTLDFAVRGDLLNTWVNGTLRNVYRLPTERKEGTFTIWAHEATAEFLEVRLLELPDSIPLAEKPGDERTSPVLGSQALTKADAEKLLKQAEATGALAKVRLEIVKANLAAIEARFTADRSRYAVSAKEADWKPLAVLAGKAERRIAVLKAEEALLAKPSEAAKKAHADALTAAAKDDSAYTSLINMDSTGSTGRRLALAKWITDKQNPLTARVAVNHLWLRHFGAPLVPSVANFGLSGKKPTHPELLDYLAVELVDSGWSMKKMHRLMVTSQAYRLSSRNVDGVSKTADPENRFYWRANARRMEAELVRDSLLAVSGQLDPTMGGPIIDEKLGQTSKRRSVYFRFNTQYRMEFLDQFDAANPTECFERKESVIPQQALALHNSVLAINVSRDVAKQIKAAEPGVFVRDAFERVLGRLPTDEERERCLAFLAKQAELYKTPGKLTPFPPGPATTPPSTDPAQRAREDLIHVLFNHNDFVTIR